MNDQGPVVEIRARLAEGPPLSWFPGPGATSLRVGSAPECDWRIPGAAPRHLILLWQDRTLRLCAEQPVIIDGQLRHGWTDIHGGSTVDCGVRFVVEVDAASPPEGEMATAFDFSSPLGNAARAEQTIISDQTIVAGVHRVAPPEPAVSGSTPPPPAVRPIAAHSPPGYLALDESPVASPASAPTPPPSPAPGLERLFAFPADGGCQSRSRPKPILRSLLLAAVVGGVAAIVLLHQQTPAEGTSASSRSLLPAPTVRVAVEPSLTAVPADPELRDASEEAAAALAAGRGDEALERYQKLAEDAPEIEEFAVAAEILYQRCRAKEAVQCEPRGP